MTEKNETEAAAEAGELDIYDTVAELRERGSREVELEALRAVLSYRETRTLRQSDTERDLWQAGERLKINGATEGEYLNRILALRGTNAGAPMERCRYCEQPITQGVVAGSWVHVKTGLTTCRRSGASKSDGIFNAEPAQPDAPAADLSGELLPCPFDGRTPALKKIPTRSLNPADDYWIIACEVYANGGEPLIDDGCGVYQQGRTREEVIRRWNTRTAASVSPPVGEVQTWCDHCSADLNGVRHVLCEKCYRFIAGPKWTASDFDPSTGSPDAVSPADAEAQAREATRRILGLREGLYCYARTCFKNLEYRPCHGCEDFDAIAKRVAQELQSSSNYAAGAEAQAREIAAICEQVYALSTHQTKDLAHRIATYGQSQRAAGARDVIEKIDNLLTVEQVGGLKRIIITALESLSLTTSERVTCTWKFDPDGYWQTECGDQFMFSEGGPTENRVKFCHYCGRTCKESIYENGSGGGTNAD